MVCHYFLLELSLYGHGSGVQLMIHLIALGVMMTSIQLLNPHMEPDNPYNSKAISFQCKIEGNGV